MKKQLIEARELAFNNADAIMKLGETEKRSLTAEELEKVRGYHAEMDELDTQIDAIEKQEKLRAANAKTVIPAVHGNNPAQSKEEKKIIERFNVLSAIRHLHDPVGHPLEGAEKEIDQEGRKEQREAQVDHLVKAGVNIPSFAMREDSIPVTQLRANEQVAGDNALGGFTVGRDLVEVIGILRPRLAVRQAGARVLTGLTGNLDFTTQSSGGNTNWATEIASADQSNVAFTQASMTPHRLAAWTHISLQLLAQSSISMQQFVVDDLNNAMNAAIENAVFNGTGSGAVPQGLLGEVPELGIGVDGGAFTYDHAVDMETVLQSAESVMGAVAYILNSKTVGQAKKERTDAGSGIFTIPQNSNMINGYPFYVSNHLPSDLDKGSSVGVCSAAVLGNWNDLLIGNWGGANLVIDNMTAAKEGMITVVTNTFWDILARRLSSFVSTSDIVTG